MSTSSTIAPSLRVVSLQAQNIMRLTAVEIAWDKDASTLTIGGRNRAGKSSVLNAVAMALGGAALCPDEPIRAGESEGFVEVNLGELVVRREFKREHLPCDKPCADYSEVQDTGLVHIDACAWHKFGETKSRIGVKNAEGIRLGTPQAILDKLIGKLSFDPLAFATMSNEGPDGVRRQAEILRRLVGLDLTDLEAKRKAAFERRAHYNKEFKEADARLAAMPTHKDAGLDEVPMQAISDEMLKAEEHRKLAAEADREVDKVAHIVSERSTVVGSIDAKIQEVEKHLASLREQLTAEYARLADAEKELEARKITAEAARAVVPDVEVIRKKLSEVEATNAKVRANKAYQQASEALNVIGAKAKAEDAEVKRLEQAKADALQALKFPVEGLGVGDDGVTFNGIPFKQASTAEQIKVSVAVGFALNPGLKLLLVRNGNALDEDSMKAVAAQAEAAGGQILMEFVTKDAGQVSVMIEDGRVA